MWENEDQLYIQSVVIYREHFLTTFLLKYLKETDIIAVAVNDCVVEARLSFQSALEYPSLVHFSDFKIRLCFYDLLLEMCTV